MPRRSPWRALVRGGVAAIGLFCLAVLGPGPAVAQSSYPSKPIRLVVGFSPGGAADVLTRIMAQALGKQLGQQLTERLSQELRGALQRPDVRQQLAAQGFDGYGMTPAQFSAFFKLQWDSFTGVVRDNGIKFD